MNCGKLAFDTSRRAQLFATDSECITFKSSSFSWDAQASETETCLRYLCHPFELALRVPLFAMLVLDSLMRPMSAFSRTAGREWRRHSTWRRNHIFLFKIFRRPGWIQRTPVHSTLDPHRLVRLFARSNPIRHEQRRRQHLPSAVCKHALPRLSFLIFLQSTIHENNW
jgi:hypothetical protein